MYIPEHIPETVEISISRTDVAGKTDPGYISAAEEQILVIKADAVGLAEQIDCSRDQYYKDKTKQIFFQQIHQTLIS
jgi:hypothetical protein